jgi:hypothetical protein
VDYALYSSLCRTMRAICLRTQARQSAPGPLLVEWQSWARAFVAGLYHRKSAERAALSARWEAALLELDDPEAGQFGHAAADLAWAAIHAAAGEHEKAEALGHAARERIAAALGTAAVAQTLDGHTTREPDGRRTPGAASQREADAATHATLLIERYGPTTAAEMTALYVETSGSDYWRSGSAKTQPGDGSLITQPTRSRIPRVAVRDEKR